MARNKIDREIYKERIIKSLLSNPRPQMAYELAHKSNLPNGEMAKLLNELIDEGKIIKQPIIITKFSYKLK